MTTHTPTSDEQLVDEDVAVGCTGCLPVVIALVVLWALFIGAVVMITLAVTR